MSLSTLADRYCPDICRPFLNRVQQSPIGKRIVSGTFWSVVGNGFAKVFSFITIIIVARILGKEVFGEFGLVRSTASTFVVFSSFGMGLTATKYISELLYIDKERVGRIIGLTYVFSFFMSLIIAVIFYNLAAWICETHIGKPELVGVMRLGAMTLVFLVFGSAQTGVLMGYQDFRSIALSAIISGILALPVYIFNSYYWGLEGTVMAMFIFSIFTNLINSLFIYKNCRTHHIRYSFFDAYKELPILWRSNFPVFLSTTIWSISIWLTQLMLASYSEGTSTLGIYYVVINYQMIMSFLPLQLRSVFFPTFSQLSNKKNSDQYWRVVKKSWLLNIVTSLLIAFPFLLFPKFFMGIYGIEFIEGWYVLVIAGLSVIAISCSEIAYQIIKSHGKFWTDCIICTICMVLYVFIVHILLQSGYGEVSLFYAIILTSSIGAMIIMTLIWNHRNKIEYI